MTNSNFWKIVASQAQQKYDEGYRPKLLGINPKVVKGEKYSYSTKILHLSPATSISKKSMCPFASKGCEAACLNTSGLGAEYIVRKDGSHTIHVARAVKTIWYRSDLPSFLTQLHKEIRSHDKLSRKKGLIPCVRLNGTSDIRWETHEVPQKHPLVIFYDYTKDFKRTGLPPNYHLTYSSAEDNNNDVFDKLNNGNNVAVVFRTDKVEDLPKVWKNHKVINGDDTDLRFLDETNVIVGLTCKGKALRDTTGFVKELQ